MQPEDFKTQTYRANCERCGDPVEVNTQPDNRPEYYTAVSVKCRCGNWVEFRLPVN